jgi:hypothetical protein
MELVKVMVFYMVLTYIVGVLGGYWWGGVSGAGNGFVGMSVLSIILWFVYGKKMVIQ